MTVDDDQVTQPSIVHPGEESEVASNLPPPVLSNPSIPVAGTYHSSSPDPDPDPDPENNPPEDPWFPFLSKPHMQLCLLYHGSHRKNMDQVSLQAIMDILKVCVLLLVASVTILDISGVCSRYHLLPLS